MSAPEPFDFLISPEPHNTNVDMTTDNHVEIAFVVRNISGRTVRAEPLINPLPGSKQMAAGTVESDPLLRHMQITEQGDWEFANDAVCTYTVRLDLPVGFDSGSYRFQLLIVGTDDPDNQVVESDVVTLTVSGPSLNPRPYLLAAVVVLAAIILLAVGAALFLRPIAQLEVVLDGAPPSRQMTEGKLESYTLKISNLRQEPLENVSLDYRLPQELISVSAFVRDSSRRNCRESERSLHCDLGDLQPGVPVFLTIEVLPGLIGNNTVEPTLQPTTAASPQPTTGFTAEIDHLKAMIFSRQLEGKSVDIPVNLPSATSTLSPRSQDVYLAIVPEQRVALTGEELNYEILAWSHSPMDGSFTFTYTLPPGLVYSTPLPSGCSQDPTDYFKLVCAPITRTEPRYMLSLRVPAVASASAESLEHRASLEYEYRLRNQTSTELQVVTRTIESTATTSAVSTALMFDGVDDWAQLGLKTGLPTFTAEMWVHPFSTEDGQAFISVHRQRGTNKVDNLFSVGYYDGGISVEVNGEYYYLDREKIAERFHLAVVVEKLQDERWQAIVYINGKIQPWSPPEEQEPGEQCTADGVEAGYCMWFASPKLNRAESALDGNETLQWSLGQEWDDGASAPKNSDFFYGSLSEVRVWTMARTLDQIVAGMNRRLQGDEDGLIGYWPLEPLDVSSNTLADRALGKYPGTRHQASWDDITPRFGAALAFNGIDDSLLVDDLRLSDNFVADENGKVKLTMAGWFYVDGVPSRQQWLLGSAAPGSETTGLLENGRSPAEETLAAAQQARQVINLDPAEVRIALQAARDELYRTLDPLTGGFDPAAYNDRLLRVLAKKTPVEEKVPVALTDQLDDLIKARGELPELISLRQAKLNFDREQRLYERALQSGVDYEITRGEFRTEAARREYARALAEVWQTYARDRVTVPVLLPAALDKSMADRLLALVDELEAGLARQPLPARALNNLALLELYEANLAGDFLTGDLLPESPEAQDFALFESQDILKKDLEQNEAYLESLLGLQDSAAGIHIQAEALDAGPNLPDPDLLGYWKFDEGSGAFTHAYPSKGGPGLLSGGAAFISSSPASSGSAFALAFDSSNAAVTMNSPLPAGGVSDLTLAFWIYPQADGEVLNIRTSATSVGDFTCELYGYLLLTCGQGGQGPVLELEDYQNTWVHVTFQYNFVNKIGGTGYLNGVVIQDSLPRDDIGKPVDLSGSLRLGSINADRWAFTGSLDELLIYQRSLAPDEIERLAGGLPPAQDEVLQRLDALRAVQALWQAQSNLQVVIDADAHLAQAQRAVDQANASVDPGGQIATDALKADEKRTNLEVQVAEAQAALASATPAERAAAQRRLERAQAELQEARQEQFEDLGMSIVLLQEREQILADLNPRLDEAVEKAVDAAQSALQRNNVELLVGPYLDIFFEPDPPRKTSYQAAYPEALLAAQLVLKSAADGKVDLARAKYNAAVEARDRLVGSTNSTQTRQEIIGDINKYIDAVNRDVNLAKAELDRAVEEQRASQPDSRLQSVLAEALAQTLAQRVASELAARYPVTPTSTITPDPRLAELVKARLKAELFTSLESVRRPLRLRMYYETYYAVTRLDRELQAGIDQAPERIAKANLRDSLVKLNTALFSVLQAQNVLSRPAVGFDALLEEVADESDRATQLDQRIQALDDALKNASGALSVPVLGIHVPELGTAAPDNAASPTATPVAGGENSTSDSTAISGTQAAQSLDQVSSSQTSDGQPSGPETSSTPAGGNQPNTGLSGGLSTNEITTPALVGSSLSDGSNVFAPPPNIWAGLILTDDGHVAVVARPVGAATWAIRKDERSIPVGRWVHYAAVIIYDVQTGEIDIDADGAIPEESLKLYRNGTSAKGVPEWAGTDEIRMGSTNCAPNFYIGGLCAGAGGYNFRGRIDDVRIWNRVLEVKEIQIWLDLPGEASNEVAYWSYDDILGGVSPDAGSCEPGQACDLAGSHNLNVIGPVWIPPDPHLLQNSTTP